MNAQEKFDAAVALAKQFVPDYNTTFKSQSRLHRAVGWLLSKLGNPGYMINFWTTIGSWTARPTICEAGATDTEWQVVLHEAQHAKDSKAIGLPLFCFLYLFPQIIGILGVLFGLVLAVAVPLGASPWLLLGLLSLLTLLPLPALGRAYLEMRGYTVSLAVSFWSGDLGDEGEFLDWMDDMFSGPSYYFMLPFKRVSRWYFSGKLKELKTNTITLDAYLRACKTLCSKAKA
jgi:hypothetical protein